jgi:hypothetical protein
MKYLVHWRLPYAEYSSSAAQFLETGAMPPPGLNIVGRWAGEAGEGFAIADADDEAEVDRYRTQWADLVDLEVTPYVEEDETAAAPGPAGTH